MKIIFIRHGLTAGNLKKAYIGTTDEPLCLEGISMLESRTYPDCDIVIASPMKRCIQTAELIYRDKKAIAYNELRECDFGDFEGKSYSELNGNPDYQKWIDSGGSIPFPNGEAPRDFKKRCIAAFKKAVGDFPQYNTLCFVVHGGTIMSVLEEFAVPRGSYYDYQIPNGSGYVAEFDGEKITVMEKI